MYRWSTPYNKRLTYNFYTNRNMHTYTFIHTYVEMEDGVAVIK